MAETPLRADAPLPHGRAIAFRDHLRAIKTLEEQIESIAHDSPCEPLRLTLAGLKRMYTDDADVDIDNDQFRDCSQSEVRIDEDDFKRFADAAQSLDGASDSPDRFNALQACFREAVTNATRRSLAANSDDKWSNNRGAPRGGRPY